MCIRDRVYNLVDALGDMQGLAVDVIRLSPQSCDMAQIIDCLLYTSDAADERSSVDLGGRRIIKKKKEKVTVTHSVFIKIENQEMRRSEYENGQHDETSV